MNNIKLCPLCGSKNISRKGDSSVKIPVRGKLIEVTGCGDLSCNNCGETFSTFKKEHELIDKARKIYRERHNIPSPEEIKLFMAKYELSYRDIQKITGITTKTIERYLNGLVPDLSNANLLKLIMHDSNNLKKMTKNTNSQKLISKVTKAKEKTIIARSYKEEIFNKPEKKWNKNPQWRIQINTPVSLAA